MSETKGRNLGGNNFSKTDPQHKDYWSTPQEMVEGLIAYCEAKGVVPKNLARLDVCASELNTKCERFITEEQNTLETDWGYNQLCWLNPPYSNVMPFLEKAESEQRNGNYTIALLKNDCSTKWFHFAARHARAIIFITKGRIGFVSAITGKRVGGNNFSSVVFVFGGGDRLSQRTLYVSKSKLEGLGNA